MRRQTAPREQRPPDRARVLFGLFLLKCRKRAGDSSAFLHGGQNFRQGLCCVWPAFPRRPRGRGGPLLPLPEAFRGAGSQLIKDSYLASILLV